MTSHSSGRWRRRSLIICVGILILGGVAWVERRPLFVWYYVRGLTLAGENERDGWMQQVVGFDRIAVPRLLGCLQQDSARVCMNAQLCLTRLIEKWGIDDVRSRSVLQQLAETFPTLSVPGQLSVLQLQRALGQLVQETQLSSSVSRAIATTLLQSARAPEAKVRAGALTIALGFVDRKSDTEIVHACRELVKESLRDEARENRVRAIRLAMQPSLELRDAALPMLRDSDPEIRRAAMLVIGPSEEAIATDDLLHWLHDSDIEVQKLCESALLGRGLTEQHLKMGRLMTSEHAGVRLQVLALLRRNFEVEPGIWLRRLSHDPDPAVRAASVRTSAEFLAVDLTDRLEQMSQNDPSPTVRQLAQFYLSCRKSE